MEARIVSHCTIDQLTDYLLGRAAEETGAQVEAHLASGCGPCDRLLATLSRIQRVGRFDATHQPPGHAVRAVKALYGVDHARRQSRPVEMRLSFDSRLSPSTVGTRSLHTSSRHLVFYSQNHALDLRLDSERSTRDVVVVGQLLNRNWGPLPDVHAFLVSGGRVVAHSTTGCLGEFHMECRPAGSMRLQLAVDDKELIDVELDRRQPADQRPIPRGRVEPTLPSPLHSRKTDAAL